MADDDWETDPDYVNDVTEKEQRWGSKSVPGSGRLGHINLNELREDTLANDSSVKNKTAPKMSYGYGGKFGVEKNRMDKTAVGHDFVLKTEKHSSQKDYAEGFGGKYGIQSDRQDKSAVDWSHKHISEKHSSQKDYSQGFGGQYGVQKDRQDKSAVGWDHKENVEKHSSQKDYSHGFGGKFGIQEDRKDSTTFGDNLDSPEKNVHGSQVPVIPDKPADMKSIRDLFENKNSSNKNSSDQTTAKMSQLRVKEDMQRANEERKLQFESESSSVPQEASEKQNETSSSIALPEAENHKVSGDVYASPTLNHIEAKEETPKAVAMYDYTADEEDEITFEVGEQITQIEKITDGWWKGMCRDKFGLFPANYVEEITQ